jgi:hypothetical protein
MTPFRITSSKPVYIRGLLTIKDGKCPKSSSPETRPRLKNGTTSKPYNIHAKEDPTS